MRSPHRRWTEEPAEAPENTIQEAYHAVFSTAAGKTVLDDLWKRANEPSIDYKNVSADVCIYRVARVDLLRDILRQTEKSKSLNFNEDYP